VAGNVTFMGAGAALQFDQSVSQIGGDIVRAAPGNAIDLRYQLFTSGEHAVWQQTAGQSGTLTLLDGSGAVLANLNLVGRYATSQFITASDAAAGTSIFLQQPQNPGPPGNSTADMIMTDGNGDYEIYDIGGNAILAAYLLGQAPPPLSFVGLGTFQAGDTSDMMLRSASTGAFEVYDISNNNITGAAALGTVGLNWQVAGFGNFSSLGETDMILRDGSSGGLQVYDINNNQITASAFMGAVGLDWQFSGVGNFSGRGESDMLLRNANTGGLEVYDISNNQITGAAFIGTVGLDWQFSGVGNFSGVPGETDLLLRNVNTGGLEVYDINNNQITGAAFLGMVGLDWQFAGVAPIQAAGASDLCCATPTPANSRSTTSPTIRSPAPPAWGRSGWIGSSAASLPRHRPQREYQTPMITRRDWSRRCRRSRPMPAPPLGSPRSSRKISKPRRCSQRPSAATLKQHRR
jgi:hypothetical protein